MMGDELHNKAHAKSTQSLQRNQEQKQTIGTRPNTQSAKKSKSEVNLLRLRNGLGLFHCECDAWLNDKKRKVTSAEVSQFGIKIVQRLVTSKVLTKKHLDEIRDVTATSPQRVCSAGPSPSRPSPRGSSGRSKSENRLSRRDQYVKGKENVKTTLKFDDEDDIDVRSRKQIPDERNVHEELYINNVELKAEVKDLRSKLESMKEESTISEQQFNNLYTAFANLQHDHAALDSELNKVRIDKEQLENHIDVLDNEIARLNIGEKTRSARDTQSAVSLKDNVDRYRAERNEVREKYKKLTEDFKQFKEKVENKIVCMQYERQKAEEKVKSLQNDTHFLRKKLEEKEKDLKMMTEAAESYNRANDNQQKYILELQNRNIKPDDEVVKDANAAILHYTAETEKYKELNELAKSENLKLKMDKDELQSLMQKHRASAKDEKEKNASANETIDLLNKKMKTLETACEKYVSTIEKQTAHLTSLKLKLKNIKDTRDQQDMKRHEQDCIKLKQENEGLEDKLIHLENQHAAAAKEHIDSEQKLKNEMNRYKNERNRLQEKVKSLDTEVGNLSSKLKEQRVMFTLENENLQSSIKRLKYQLNAAEHYQIENFSTRAADYQKEEIDKKNEEMVRLTRQLYDVEEKLKSCKGQIEMMENKTEEQSEVILRLSQQLKSSVDRSSTSKRLSDIEKENASLKKEVTEAVESLERNRNLKDRYDRDCSTLRTEIERFKNVEKEKDSLEIDNIRLKDQINQLQVQWNKLKADRTQEIGIAEEVMNLKEQKFKLENDKLLMRQEILSLKEKVKTMEEYRHSNEELKSQIESLKASMRGLKSDKKILEEKCRSETTARMTRDDISSKYRDDCDRLRKERSAAQQEVVKLSREREEFAKRLKTETESLKLEVDKTRNEKSELSLLYKAQLKKEEDKIKTLEKQNEILKKRTTSDETFGQQQAYELLQLKNDYDVCKNQRAQLQEELEDLKMDNDELEQKLKATEDHECSQCPLLRRDIESLTKQLDEQNGRLDEIEGKRCESCDELNHTLMRTESELKDVQRRLTREENRKCQKCDEYERKLSQAKKEYQELQDKFHVAKTNAQNTGRDVHDMREQIESERSNLKSLQRKVEALEREKNVVETALHDKESELSKVRGELASLDRRITSLQDENADLQRRCKSREEALVKMDLDMRQLKIENGQIKSDMVTLKQDKETLVSKLETERYNKSELEGRLRSKSAPVVSDQKTCQNCWKHRNEISEMRRELEEMRDRLSEAAGNKLRDNNPNIADLSDMNRPTSLAEKFSSLYTDEYTDAMEAIEDDMDEPASVEAMLNWIKQCYDWCEKLAKEQREKLTKESIGFMSQYHKLNSDASISDRCLIHVKEFQKKIAFESLPAVDQICRVKSVTEQKFKSDKQIIKYIKRCTELCWLMQITDPPLYLKFDVAQDESLDKNFYNVFTKSGSKIDYMVWPILFLYKNGPMLAKGVAQGK